MVRVVKTEAGAVVDARQRMPGRGAYVHADAGCVARSIRGGGLARALKCGVPMTFLKALGEAGEARNR